MRITLVSPYALSVPGGVQNQVLGLARVLAARGDAVQVIAPGVAGERIGSEPFPFEVVRIGATRSVPVNGSRAPVALSLRSARRAIRAISAFAPEIVHLHEPLAPVVGPAVLATLARRRASASRPTRPAAVGTFHRAGAGFAYRAYGHVSRPLTRALDAVFAVSGPARDTLRAAVGGEVASRCALAFNGVDLERFARAAPWTTPSVPVVCFAGRHEVRKGLSILLSALSEFAGPVQVWVIGSGPETATLRERHRGDDRVLWLGRVDDDELAQRFAAASVVVSPAIGGESFGIVTLEAMAAGAPVIASDLPGHREAGGDAAVYVPPGNAAALARALAELLADPRRREVLVAAGRDRARERSLEALGELYRACFLALLGR